MIPSLANLLIQLLKGTAVVSFITLSDLTFRVNQLRQSTGDTLFAFTVGLLVYGGTPSAMAFAPVSNRIAGITCHGPGVSGRSPRAINRSPPSTTPTTVPMTACSA